jgi:hypothetical protein
MDRGGMKYVPLSNPKLYFLPFTSFVHDFYTLITSPTHMHRTHVTPGRRRRIPQTPLGRQNAAPETHCARERRKWLAALT